jgi:hypothetical protein
MNPVWQPAIPLRFIERDGRRILQQAWVVLHAGYDSNDSLQWRPTGKHEWRDVPMADECADPTFWSQPITSEFGDVP